MRPLHNCVGVSFDFQSKSQATNFALSLEIRLEVRGDAHLGSCG
jgi:hypothetical protein